MFFSLQEKLRPNYVISGIEVIDVRFPTSIDTHISDIVHTNPDFSAAYVIMTVEGLEDHVGHGWTFTEGRGTEIVVTAIKSLIPMLVGQSLYKVYTDFGSFWHGLVNESQLRWIGPEKGAVHLAAAAVINALWDLWGKIEGKPVWKLLCDMSPQEIASLVDFTYLSDALTKEEAIDILTKNVPTKKQREIEMERDGYPAYTTSVGWLRIPDETVKSLCKSAQTAGFTRFKMKIGLSIEDDTRRAELLRKEIGWNNILMMDVNQKWDVGYAIHHMTQLAKFKPLWIEEPTSCDDILGHAKIAQALKKYNIGVATGECCHNRVMFKQFLEYGAMDYCQVDCCRLGGVNEILAVLLLAAKFNIPVCPHAGGVGLCEYTQHIVFFDYICVSASLEGRMLEYADHLHEDMVSPVVINGGNYMLPDTPGYSEIKAESLEKYKFPDGPVWQELQKNEN